MPKYIIDRLKYVELPSYPLTMPKVELQSLLEDEKASVIARTAVVNELLQIRAGYEPPKGSIRAFWYRLFKPMLSRLGAMSLDYFDRMGWSRPKGNDISRKWTLDLSGVLTDLVKRGATSYEELGIVDQSRLKRSPQDVEFTLDSVTLTHAHYRNIILFTEKDTIFNEVEAMASLYGFAAISGSGECSMAATENILKKIVRHKDFIAGSDIILLGLTDYDPYGYNIFETQASQIEDIVKHQLPQVGEVIRIRLGLDLDQLEPDEVAANAYPLAINNQTEKKVDDWMQKTGGVYGQPLGLELDALPIERIRSYFIQGIQDVLPDEEPYHEDLKQAFLDMLIHQELQPTIEAMKDRLWADMVGDLILDQLDCDEDLLAQFARAGASYIDPVENDRFVFRAAAVVRQKIKQTINQWGQSPRKD